jgi:GDPmannose 4,6-dehydratase
MTKRCFNGYTLTTQIWQMKRALITGITGQDGSYLARNLIDNGYKVCGVVRNHTLPNHLEKLKWAFGGELPGDVSVEYSDLTDAPSLTRVIQDFAPDEVYNLAAQSHVGVSFKSPVSTAAANAIGVMNVLEACRAGASSPRFYQASTSEMFGKVQSFPQNEETGFYPRSPYGVAKLFGYWLTVNYRESYDMFGANGILFNHESPIRGDNFVTKKVTKGLVAVMRNKIPVLEIGNLEAKRDWGHAKDYVEAMRLILQQETPQDYVIATGIQHSVRQFCEIAADYLELELEWRGEGVNEIGYSHKLGKTVIAINPQFYRPAEVDTLLGDCTKAYRELGWEPRIGFEDLVKEMITYDLATV